MSTQRYIECPDCKYKEAIEDYFNDQQKTFITCNQCGYFHYYGAKIDNGKYVLENGKFVYYEEELHGAGVFEIHYKSKKGFDVGRLYQNNEERKKQISDLKEYESKNSDIEVVIHEYLNHTKE